MLPKMSAYRRDSDENQYFFLDKRNGELLQKYNEIWNKVSNTIKKGFDSKLVYNEKYLRTKIKLYEGKPIDKIPKEGSQCIYLSVILIDSVFRAGKLSSSYSRM